MAGHLSAAVEMKMEMGIYGTAGVNLIYGDFKIVPLIGSESVDVWMFLWEELTKQIAIIFKNTKIETSESLIFGNGILNTSELVLLSEPFVLAINSKGFSGVRRTSDDSIDKSAGREKIFKRLSVWSGEPAS